jgi:hypothetical protein
MKKTAFLIMLIPSLLSAATLDLRPDTVLVADPTLTNQPATKKYVDDQIIAGSSDDTSWRNRTNDWNSVSNKQPAGTYLAPADITNKVDAASLGTAAYSNAGAFYPANNPSGYVSSAGTTYTFANTNAAVGVYTNGTVVWIGTNQTGGGLTAADVTNDLNLAVSPSLTQTVAKASTALQAIITNGTPIGDYGMSAFTVDAVKMGKLFPAISFVGYDESENFYSNSLAILSDGFYRLRGTQQPIEYAYKIYDEGNFLAGTHYLSPSGPGSNLTGITAAQVGSVATNDARYLASLTNLTAAAIAAAGGVTNNGATINGQAISNGAAITVSGGGFTNYVPAYQLWSAPTVTLTRAMGELVRLDCTSAVNFLTIDSSGWDTNGAGRVTMDLYKGGFTLGFDTAAISNSALLDISTNTVTPLFFRKPAGLTTWRVRQ